jgi:hypothetical protein
MRLDLNAHVWDCLCDYCCTTSDSGSGAQAMRPEGAQPVGPQSGGEQPHRPKPVSSQKAG